jgi:sterol desaturase/sphingolipid hydroxylase (fatty acid hydroxylase superfamily)
VFMFSALMAGLPATFFSMIAVAAVVMFWRIIEKNNQAERHQAAAEILLDYKLVALRLVAQGMARSLLWPVTIRLVNIAGGGLIHFRADGLWIVPSLIVWLLISDLIRYWFHRLQHVVPCLWAMHSLHHSATAVTGSTGGRHCWLEEVFSLLVSAPLIGIAFSVPLEILNVVGMIQFANAGFTHANIRVYAGLLINSPQLHRLHHSRLAEHTDKNFAELLPMWDLLFGTLARPKSGEYPSTGLLDGTAPRSVLEGLVWPFRAILGHRDHVMT